MGAPSDYPRGGEQRGVELLGYPEHVVDEPAVEVHVGCDARRVGALLQDQLRSEPLDGLVHAVVVHPALLDGQLLHEGLENERPRVGFGVDRVPHPVDQPLVVEDLLVQDLGEVAPHLLLAVGVLDMALDVVHHVHDLQVRAAVLGSLEGRHRCCDDGVGVGSRRGGHAGGERRIVPSAVLHVQNERQIQDGCLQVRVGLVRPEHAQDVLRGGQVGVRAVDVHALVVDVVVVRVVAVHREHGEHADQVDALPEDVLGGVVQRFLVIRGEEQDAPGNGVHDVLVRRLHDDVPGERDGQPPLLGEVLPELLQLGLVRQVSEQQEVRALLEAEALVEESAGQVLDVVAPVAELPLAGHLDPVDHLGPVDLRYAGQTDHDPAPFAVAESLLDVVPLIELRGEAVDGLAHLRFALYESLVFAVHRDPLA